MASPATSTRTRLWHPFAAMGKVDGHELVLTRGEGCRVWDIDGNEYVDATAGLWFVNVGHGRAEIADAVAEQLRTLAAHHVFGDQANPPALELAARLADLAPVEDAREVVRIVVRDLADVTDERSVPVAHRRDAGERRPVCVRAVVREAA